MPQAAAVPSRPEKPAAPAPKSIAPAPDVHAAPIEYAYPERMAPYPAWLGHTPFAFWLVEKLRPDVLVELGVHSGNSYCAFLQAVKALGLRTRCYGVDHWHEGARSGDGEAVYADIKRYHDARYGEFSTLLRRRFDDALPQFADGSIDLLHIDGSPDEDSLRADLTKWLPKMSARGILLVHDACVRQGTTAWRAWDEIAERYPSFTFAHAHGLGVAHVGRSPAAAGIESLFAGGGKADATCRTYFHRLGASVTDRYAAAEAEGRTRAAMRLAEARPPEAVSPGVRQLAAERELRARMLRQRIEADFRLQKDIAELTAKNAALEASLAAGEQQMLQAREEIAAISLERADMDAVRAEASRLRESLDALRHDRDGLQAEHAALAERQRAGEAELLAAARQQRTLSHHLWESEAALARYKAGYEAIARARFWRLTAPLRRIVEALRRLSGTSGA